MSSPKASSARRLQYPRPRLEPRTGTGPTVAACLIVRNGARTLPRFLDSIRAHVDEVCILDTGSIDGTLELLAQAAREPGAAIRVERAQWAGDYAAARNASHAMATADYVIWFDDDEIVEGGENLRDLLGPDVLYVRRVEIYELGRAHGWFGQRIARRGLGTWRSPVHERLYLPPAASAAVASPDRLTVLHRPLGAPDRHDYQAVVEQAFAAEPSRILLSVLAVNEMHAGNNRAAAELFGRAVDPLEPLPPWEQTGPMADLLDVACLEQLAACYKRDGRLTEAVEAARQAVLLRLWREQHDPLLAECAALDARYPPSASVWELAGEELLSDSLASVR